LPVIEEDKKPELEHNNKEKIALKKEKDAWVDIDEAKVDEQPKKLKKKTKDVQ